MNGLFGRTFTWIESQPEWLRPILYGAVTIPAAVILRGGLILIPVLVLAAVIRGQPIAQDLLLVTVAFMLAVAGGAASGAVYSLIGRHVRELGVVGPYLAGWLSCWPYVLVLLAILRLEKARPVAASLDRGEGIVLVGMTFWVGLLVGHFLLRDD
jgi:hypothetical protein